MINARSSLVTAGMAINITAFIELQNEAAAFAREREDVQQRKASLVELSQSADEESFLRMGAAGSFIKCLRLNNPVNPSVIADR